MNTERDKFLTESMDKCWHEWPKQGVVNAVGGCLCSKCNRWENENNDFSTWNGFGKLWEWAIKEDWWFVFLESTGRFMQREFIRIEFIDPEIFADAVYEFLHIEYRQKVLKENF